MQGLLTFQQLTQLVADNTIDTVIAAICDMQGRLMGKRFHAKHFVTHAHRESHCCNYLLATDMEMYPVPGYQSTSWESGYGDYVMQPDLSTLRVIPWLPATALVLCDVVDHHHQPVAHDPRTILKKQVSRLKELGFTSCMATELEFFVFRESFDTLRDEAYNKPTPYSAYNEDYHILQTSKEEPLMRAIRNGLYGAGIEVENTKGEASAGQAEINVRYSNPVNTADSHILTKNAIKEIAYKHNYAVTFMAKWSQLQSGSSSHTHQSLYSLQGDAVFYSKDDCYGMSPLMRHYLAGLLRHSDAITLFLAPYINSYKRFAAGTFAPTQAVWSLDNRTAGYRIVSPESTAVRIECRIGGSDVNPYLALAAQLAAGMAGIIGKYDLEAEFRGDAYNKVTTKHIPKTLIEAINALDKSQYLRETFGDEVVDHYLHAARWEQQCFDKVVTDYERIRFFERA